MKPHSGDGLIDIPSNHSVDETVEKLRGILQAKGITLFALVDHSGEAAKVDMKMRPTKLLIFGNPKGGNSGDVGGAQHRHRSAAQDFDLGRYPGKSPGHLQ